MVKLNNSSNILLLKIKIVKANTNSDSNICKTLDYDYLKEDWFKSNSKVIYEINPKFNRFTIKFKS